MAQTDQSTPRRTFWASVDLHLPMCWEVCPWTKQELLGHGTELTVSQPDPWNCCRIHFHSSTWKRECDSDCRSLPRHFIFAPFSIHHTIVTSIEVGTIPDNGRQGSSSISCSIVNIGTVPAVHMVLSCQSALMISEELHSTSLHLKYWRIQDCTERLIVNAQTLNALDVKSLYST